MQHRRPWFYVTVIILNLQTHLRPIDSVITAGYKMSDAFPAQHNTTQGENPTISPVSSDIAVPSARLMSTDPWQVIKVPQERFLCVMATRLCEFYL